MKSNFNSIIILIFLLPIISLSQTDSRSKDGTGFDSVFQNLDSGIFYGTVNGVLLIKNSVNEKSILDFQGSNATLEIEKDPDEVYDVSFKKYIGETTSGKTEVIYQTYGLANSLAIKLNGDYYELTLIDGGCDLIINGLEYSYESETKTEYLIIQITKDITLKNDVSLKSIKILQNSTLTFALKRTS